MIKSNNPHLAGGELKYGKIIGNDRKLWDPLLKLPSGKHTKNYGKIHGQSTISIGQCSIANCLITRGYIPLSGL